MAATGAENSPSIVSRSRGFLSESVEELKKVSAPTKQETMQATVVTILLVVFLALCLFLVDLVFHQIMSSVL